MTANPSARGGPPLVLLHGFALHGGFFSPLVPALSKKHRVHVVDLPGHGFSAPLAPSTCIWPERPLTVPLPLP